MRGWTVWILLNWPWKQTVLNDHYYNARGGTLLAHAVLAGATKSVTDTLQRVMNAAARVVSDTRKFDHGLTQILHDDLHWLDVADRVTHKLGVIMHRCRHGKAPQYLVDCCTPVTDVVGRQRLRSATQKLMVVPRHRLTTVGRRAFAVHGSWSGTPCQTTSAHSRTMSPLDRAWKPGFSPDTSVFSALETFMIIALYKSTFTIPYHRFFGTDRLCTEYFIDSMCGIWAWVMDCGRTETQYIQMAAADLIQTPPRFISLDNAVMGRSNTIRYDRGLRDAILTCARKPT